MNLEEFNEVYENKVNLNDILIQIISDSGLELVDYGSLAGREIPSYLDINDLKTVKT